MKAICAPHSGQVIGGGWSCASAWAFATASMSSESSRPHASHAYGAKNEVTWARVLIGHGRHERALLMSRRAETDAALAIALVREREARRAAEQAAGTTAPSP